MNFFEHQDAARRNTRVMMLLYALAVVGVVLAVDLVLAFAYLHTADIRLPDRAGPLEWLGAVPRAFYLWGALGTLGVILVVSLYHVIKLADGGAAVAQMVGARLVSRDTRDPLEKRLLNVVEEMAIAAGVRVPQAYVMDGERAINAFAAGWDVGNSVVAVTRGTLETLNRDELQGVIGHEFSHILNGDMRLNIRMIGVLEGIVFIAAIGEFMMRSSRGSRDSKGSGGIVMVGLALLVIGYIGLFFARLIKAAVSRQREFLADASSVQFTRNPDGIAGALDQIGASTRGTLIANRYAEEISHMFFGQSVKMWFGGVLATHPPLDERIARVRPGFEAPRYRRARAPADADAVPGAELGAAGFAGATAAAPSPGTDGKRAGDAGHAWGRSATESAQLVGSLDAGKVSYAARLLARFPAELRSAVGTAEGAGAVLVATLLAGKDEVLEGQLAALRAIGQGALAERANGCVPFVRKLGPAFDLAIVDLALPAVKAGSEEQKRALMAALEAVINADRRLSLHEFVVLTLVKSQLAPQRKGGDPVKYRTIDAARGDALLVLSLIAHAGRRPGADPAREREVEAAFAAGAREMGLAGAALVPKNGFNLDTAGAALENLRLLAPLAKAVLIKGLFAAVSADGTIRVLEAELMRLVGAVLDCPLPPLLEEIDPATLAA